MMPVKPSVSLILSTYSLDELIELVKEKAQDDLQEQLKMAREHLRALSESMGGKLHSFSEGMPVVKGRRGRPKGSKGVVKEDFSNDSLPKMGRRQSLQSEDNAEGLKQSTRKRATNKIPLGAHLNEILGAVPMDIDSIMKALQQRGYTSKSSDPRRVLYLELRKQIEKGNAVKSERGMYAKA